MGAVNTPPDHRVTSDTLFNRPAEIGLRCVAILNHIAPDSVDLQRMIQYDYLLVHSGAFPDAPASLHPTTPVAAGELAARRGLLEKGLELMHEKGLISKAFTPRGVVYQATDAGRAFWQHLRSEYGRRLSERAAWVARSAHLMSDDKLLALLRPEAGDWGTEFVGAFSIEDEA